MLEDCQEIFAKSMAEDSQKVPTRASLNPGNVFLPPPRLGKHQVEYLI